MSTVADLVLSQPAVSEFVRISLWHLGFRPKRRPFRDPYFEQRDAREWLTDHLLEASMSQVVRVFGIKKVGGQKFVFEVMRVDNLCQNGSPLTIVTFA